MSLVFLNAVIRSLEVLGEATKHVPATFRHKHPEIPWGKMAGMRDVLIHDYMGVDLMTVWKVALERLPEIKPLLEGLTVKGDNLVRCPRNSCRKKTGECP